MVELFVFIGGCLVGAVITALVVSRTKAGTLAFYEMDSLEPPVMTAILDMPVEDIHDHKFVVFKVSRQ